MLQEQLSKARTMISLRPTFLLLWGPAITFVAGQQSILNVASSATGLSKLTEAVLAASPLIATALDQEGPLSKYHSSLLI